MVNPIILVPFRYSENKFLFPLVNTFSNKTHQAKQQPFQPSMTADTAIRIDLTLQSLHTFPTRSASSSCGHHPRISTMPWQKLGHSLSPIRLSTGSYPMEYVPPRHRGSSPPLSVAPPPSQETHSVFRTGQPRRPPVILLSPPTTIRIQG